MSHYDTPAKGQNLCSNCRTPNESWTKFCVNCGHSLTPLPALSACSGCGAANAPGVKFCTTCGNPLDGQVAAPVVAVKQNTLPLKWIATGGGILLLLALIGGGFFFFLRQENTETEITPFVAQVVSSATAAPSETPSVVKTETPLPAATATKATQAESPTPTPSATSAPTATLTPKPLNPNTPTPLPTPKPPTSTPAPKATPAVPPDQGMIILQGAPNAAGLQTQVQWGDGNGNWNNVDNWRDALDETGRISWLVWAKDFNKGPFRWLVFNRDGSTQFVSAPFYLPGAGQSYLIPLDTSQISAPPQRGENCSSVAAGAFANLWQSYRHLAGCPVSGLTTIPLIAEETFEGGRMFWRSDTDDVYIAYDRSRNGADLYEGRWESNAGHKWDGSNPDGIGLSPPPGLMEPKRGFGWLWRNFLGGANSSLGWALDKEYGYDNTGQAQQFEYGVAFKGSSAKTYILLDDGRFYAQ